MLHLHVSVFRQQILDGIFEPVSLQGHEGSLVGVLFVPGGGQGIHEAQCGGEVRCIGRRTFTIAPAGGAAIFRSLSTMVGSWGAFRRLQHLLERCSIKKSKVRGFFFLQRIESGSFFSLSSIILTHSMKR